MESWNRIIDRYVENYKYILKHLYPSKNSTGFTERNMSVNFARAYEAVVGSDSCAVWYEFQFGEKNNQHFDALIVDHQKKELIFIEAKRFNNVPKKIYSVMSDIDRINKISENAAKEFKDRLDDQETYSIYGLILADVWTETDSKRNILNEFNNKTFLKDIAYQNNMNCKYFAEEAYDAYYLLGMCWKIREPIDAL